VKDADKTDEQTQAVMEQRSRSQPPQPRRLGNGPPNETPTGTRRPSPNPNRFVPRAGRPGTAAARRPAGGQLDESSPNRRLLGTAQR